MVGLLIIAFRVLVGLCGAVLIYAALFLYEDEQGKLQSTLEDWWIKIDDRSRTALSLHTLFMRNIAKLAASGFDRAFGKKLFSLKSISVSATYSLVSICLALMGIVIWGEVYHSNFSIFEIVIHILITILSASMLLIIGSLHIFIRKEIWLKLWHLFVLVVFLLIGVGFLIETSPAHWGWDVFFSNLLAFYCAVLIGIISDTAFIAITRKVLDWSSGIESFVKIAGLVLSNCVLAFLFIIIPFLLVEDWDLTVYKPMDLMFAWAVMSNILIALSALVFIILAVVMLMHRVVWRFIDKPLYALQRFGIAQRSKVLAAIGLTLIGISLGGEPTWLKEIVQKGAP